MLGDRVNNRFVFITFVLGDRGVEGVAVPDQSRCSSPRTGGHGLMLLNGHHAAKVGRADEGWVGLRLVGSGRGGRGFLRSRGLGGLGLLDL